MNQFTERMMALLKQSSGYFEQQTVEQHAIYRYHFTQKELYESYELAYEKALHTMPQSQAGVVRPPQQKIDKAFQGVLAEYVCHRWLIQVAGVALERVRRYDLERADFRYRAGEEYDLHVLTQSGQTKSCEIRSSIKVDASPLNAMRYYDMIGPYYNAHKLGEEQFADFYLRPMYIVHDEQFQVKTSSIIQAVVEQRVSMYVLTGAVKEDFGQLGYRKTMGQNETDYHAIKLAKLGGMESFLPKLQALLAQ